MGLLSAALLAGVLGGVAGCKSRQPDLSAVSDSGPDPAEANMAPVEASDSEAAATGVGISTQPAYSGGSNASYVGAPSQGTRSQVSGQATRSTVNESQLAAQNYPAGQQAPVERGAPEQAGQASYPNQGYPDQGNDQGQGYADQGGQTDDAQALSDAIYADADTSEQAEQPPPPLPVYDQPPAPADNYLWTPGYWGYAPAGYYWVPGAWVAAPFVGALWTPGWWGPYHNHYSYHRGYWGRYVGFYGGIPYGFGYYGTGYHGGYWNGNHFSYNRAVTNVNVTNIHNVYNRTVVVNNFRINNSVTNRYVNNVTINQRTSYNGGRGGIQARPVAAEVAAFHTQRIAPMAAQLENQRAAETNRAQFFHQNGGRPQLTAQARPLAADHVAVVPTAFHGPLRMNGTPAVARSGALAVGAETHQRRGGVDQRSGAVPVQPRGPEAQPSRQAAVPVQPRGGAAGQARPEARAEQVQVRDQQRVLQQHAQQTEDRQRVQGQQQQAQQQQAQQRQQQQRVQNQQQQVQQRQAQQRVQDQQQQAQQQQRTQQQNLKEQQDQSQQQNQQRGRIEQQQRQQQQRQQQQRQQQQRMQQPQARDQDRVQGQAPQAARPQTFRQDQPSQRPAPQVRPVEPRTASAEQRSRAPEGREGGGEHHR